MRRRSVVLTVLVLFTLFAGPSAAGASVGRDGAPRAPATVPLGTSFTYQGQLKNGSTPITGNCGMAFRLYDDPTVGALVGNPITTTVPVTAGLFTVGLDFGAGVFTGSARWLDISVKCGADPAFTTLAPRQALTAAPYAFALPGLYTQSNATSPNIIGGYSGNTVSLGIVGATIAGGGASGNVNAVSANYGTVGGGNGNTAGNTRATVGGGFQNTASGFAATVGGGDNNTANGQGAVVGGGGWDGTNTFGNQASGNASTIGGGIGNIVSGTWSTIGGGYGNIVSGWEATVPGGLFNKADGFDSFAAGGKAHAVTDGSFVWSGWEQFADPISSTVANEFLVRASGGITLYTDSGASVGAALFPGSSSWSMVSDRNLKANFRGVDSLQVLDALAGVAIQTWNYQSQAASIRHIGPMAQDFHAAFGVGENDTTISTVDAQGVALAAIQGLYQVVKEQDSKITALQQQSVAQQQVNADLQARLGAVEQKVNGGAPPSPAGGLPLGWLLFGALFLLNLGGLAGYLLARRAH